MNQAVQPHLLPQFHALIWPLRDESAGTISRRYSGCDDIRASGLGLPVENSLRLCHPGGVPAALLPPFWLRVVVLLCVQTTS